MFGKIDLRAIKADNTVFDFHPQMEAELPGYSKSREQLNNCNDRFPNEDAPLSVAASKVKYSAVPSDEKNASLSAGGSGGT